MGKYMRKGKVPGEVAVMDITQSSFGVRTRAKTLALQRLKKLAAEAPIPASSEFSYLQLRSRRLEKPPIGISSHDSKRQRQGNKVNPNPKPNPNPSSRVSSSLRDGSGSNLSVSVGQIGEKDAEVLVKDVEIEENDEDMVVEASFGENVLELEGRERSTRESTPCSLIRDPEGIRTPGSTTRRSGSTEANRRIQNTMHRRIPTAHEMDEFFSGAEKDLQKQFLEKYNFDPVNDKPVPGRYDWKKLDP